MVWYRAYFLNRDQRISDVAEFKSASDEQAMTHAEVLLAGRGYFSGVEVWQDARPVSLYPDRQIAAAA
jgi:hypothetical protein